MIRKSDGVSIKPGIKLSKIIAVFIGRGAVAMNMSYMIY